MDTTWHGYRSDEQPHSLKSLSTNPDAPNPDFAQRVDIETWIRNMCGTPGARAALVGPDGAGKSQLALNFVHSLRNESYKINVFWVHAETRASLEQSYRDIADRLQLPGRSISTMSVLQLVRERLQDRASGQWVIILDNADDEEILFPSNVQKQSDETRAKTHERLADYLPNNGNGAMLITGRSRELALRLVSGSDKIKEVPALTKTEGLQFLCKKLRSPPCERSLLELLDALDFIPLAITQAAAYIRHNDITISTYLDEFNSRRQETLLKVSSHEPYEHNSATGSVVLAWQMSFERLWRERRSAAELLSILCFFNSRGIPGWVLRAHSEQSVVEGEEADLSACYRDIDILQSYCLMSERANDGTYNIHPLVRHCTRAWLATNDYAAQWELRFLQVLAKEQPSGEYENWGQCQLLLPHVGSVLVNESITKQALEPWAQVVTNAAWRFWKQGDLDVAHDLLVSSVSAWQKLGMEDYEHALFSAATLSQVLQAQGNYREAEARTEEVLTRRRTLLGNEHPITLTSRSNLALVLHCQGMYEKAETINRQVLESRRRLLSEFHPDTITSLSNLAGILHCQGKYTEAEQCTRQALRLRKQVLGDDDPNTLISRSNLALILHDLGKYEKAEALNRQVLKSRRQVLSEFHPDTITSLSNLAGVLYYQGKYADAKRYNRQALELRRRVLGEFHPDTMKSVMNLALVFQALSDHENAMKLNHDALHWYEKELGKAHPDTLTSIYCFAHLLDRLGRYEDAAQLSKRAYDGRVQTLGIDHPRTIACRNHFAAMIEKGARTQPTEGG